MLRWMLAGVLAFTASTASAQSLTTAQLATLKASIAAASDQVPAGLNPQCGSYVGQAVNSLPNTGDANLCIARVYALAASPAFIVWKTNVTIGEVGKTFNATDLAGLTQLNTSRLQNLAQWLVAGVNPSLASIRQFFDDVFSGAGGANTRTALLVLWKRSATRTEKLYATGTGSDAVPALLVFEGAVSGDTVTQAREQ